MEDSNQWRWSYCIEKKDTQRIKINHVENQINTSSWMKLVCLFLLGKESQI